MGSHDRLSGKTTLSLVGYNVAPHQILVLVGTPRGIVPSGPSGCRCRSVAPLHEAIGSVSVIADRLLSTMDCLMHEVQFLHGTRIDWIEIGVLVHGHSCSRNPRETTTRLRRGRQHRSGPEPVPPGPTCWRSRIVRDSNVPQSGRGKEYGE